jgi:hypothetical protein
MLMKTITKRVVWLLLLCYRPLLWSDTILDTESIKKAVVFIYAAKADPSQPDGFAADDTKPIGTGFLVAITVPVAGKPDNPTSSVILVTARHMLDPYWVSCTDEPKVLPDRRIYIRVNNKNYSPAEDATGVGYIPVDLVKSGIKHYFVLQDDQIDGTIVDLRWGDWGEMQKSYDFRPMLINTFADEKEIGELKIGDSIASAGLVPYTSDNRNYEPLSGEKRNYPFFKFGEISNKPDEPIKINCRLVRVWFVAANLVGGNSGSPIFYSPAEFASGKSPIRRGIVIGVQSNAITGHSSQMGLDVLEPADLSGMTPIEYIFTIIKDHAAPNSDLHRGDLGKGP